MIVINKYLVPNGFKSITLWPFIILKRKQYILDNELINHESIHIAQQRETLVVWFYLRYLGEFLMNYYVVRDTTKAYELISFEREAYYNQHNLTYLSTRKRYSYRQYI